jgi:hypothetical protein
VDALMLKTGERAEREPATHVVLIAGPVK